MSNRTFFGILFFMSVGVPAHASTWQPPSDSKVIKVCGSIVKENTGFDGVQVVFEEKDLAGKIIDRTFLTPAGKHLEQEFANMRVGDRMDSCVLGVKSERRPIDSLKSLYTFETF